MNRPVALTLVFVSAFALAQTAPIRSGATIYIEPMDGYETYLAAAIAEKHVPVVVVTEKAKAQFVVRSTVAQNRPSTPDTVINNSASVSEGDSPHQQAWNSGIALGAQGVERRKALGSSDVSLAVVDPQTSAIVFAYSSGKGGTRQLQKTAEDCAKHLKEFIEKSKR